jgi:excisionase family DNA binding protein
VDKIARSTPPERIRIKEAARITRLSTRQIQDMALTGQIPGAAKLGGTWTLNEATLRAWIEERERLTMRRSEAARSVSIFYCPQVLDKWQTATEAAIDARFDELIGRARPSSRRRK